MDGREIGSPVPVDETRINGRDFPPPPPPAPPGEVRSVNPRKSPPPPPHTFPGAPGYDVYQRHLVSIQSGAQVELTAPPQPSAEQVQAAVDEVVAENIDTVPPEVQAHFRGCVVEMLSAMAREPAVWYAIFAFVALSYFYPMEATDGWDALSQVALRFIGSIAVVLIVGEFADPVNKLKDDAISGVKSAASSTARGVVGTARGVVGAAVRVPGNAAHAIGERYRTRNERPVPVQTIESLTLKRRDLLATLALQDQGDFDPSTFWRRFDPKPVEQEGRRVQNLRSYDAEEVVTEISQFYSETHSEDLSPLSPTVMFDSVLRGLQLVTERHDAAQEKKKEKDTATSPHVTLSSVEYIFLHESLLDLGKLFFKSEIGEKPEEEQTVFLKKQGWDFDAEEKTTTVGGRGQQKEEVTTYTCSRAELKRIHVILSRLEKLGEQAQFVSNLSPSIKTAWAGELPYQVDILRTPNANWELQVQVLKAWNDKVKLVFDKYSKKQFEAEQGILQAWVDRKKDIENIKAQYERDKQWLIELASDLGETPPDRLEKDDYSQVRRILGLTLETDGTETRSAELKRKIAIALRGLAALKSNPRAGLESTSTLAKHILDISGTANTERYLRRAKQSTNRGVRTVANIVIKSIENLADYSKDRMSIPTRPSPAILKQLDTSAYWLNTAEKLAQAPVEGSSRLRIEKALYSLQLDEEVGIVDPQNTKTTVEALLQGKRTPDETIRQRYLLAIKHPGTDEAVAENQSTLEQDEEPDDDEGDDLDDDLDDDDEDFEEDDDDQDEDEDEDSLL